MFQADKDGSGSPVTPPLCRPQSPVHLFGLSCVLAGVQAKCVEMTPPGRQRFSFISLLADRRLADIGWKVEQLVRDNQCESIEPSGCGSSGGKKKIAAAEEREREEGERGRRGVTDHASSQPTSLQTNKL